ncbi:helix-turn-helix domain-containing protein [Desulfobacula phenolica]|uniref:Bacteriophage CI repressor N-terminal domain-containing protein n=1 Tax=Desulfobacula phenolica TaxID=90732 RepID=A0A1H2KC14_9BACT|nr:helix-turn-helix domain-containing protein [Desulfobacula phenolica]SDU66204.1 hypothetical protein SAMN04487931_1304 [Desulfobacula phenolica]
MEATLKNRIKKIIFDRCNGSNKQFAESIGVGVSTVNLWDDDHIPKGDILQRIHTILQVNLHWLLTGKSYPYMDKSKKAMNKVGFPNTNCSLSPVAFDTQYSDEPGSFSELYSSGSGLLQKEGFNKASEMFYRILASGDKNLTQALITNLTAFNSLVKKKDSQKDRFASLEKECEELRSKFAKMDDFLRMKIAASE